MLKRLVLLWFWHRFPLPHPMPCPLPPTPPLFLPSFRFLGLPMPWALHSLWKKRKTNSLENTIPSTKTYFQKLGPWRLWVVNCLKVVLDHCRGRSRANCSWCHTPQYSIFPASSLDHMRPCDYNMTWLQEIYELTTKTSKIYYTRLHRKPGLALRVCRFTGMRYVTIRPQFAIECLRRSNKRGVGDFGPKFRGVPLGADPSCWGCKERTSQAN